jgi:hypothetical protein
MKARRLFGASILAIACMHCGSSDSTNSVGAPPDQGIAASSETRQDLGVERWTLSTSQTGNAHVYTIRGLDSQGRVAAQAAVRWTSSGSVEVSITPPNVRTQFVRAPDGAVERSVDGIRANAKAVKITQRMVADLRGTGSLAAQSLRPLEDPGDPSLLTGPDSPLLCSQAEQCATGPIDAADQPDSDRPDLPAGCAPSANLDKGLLTLPGSTLSNNAYPLSHGQSLIFSVPINQINGLTGFEQSGPDVVVTQTLVKPMVRGQDGDQELYQFTITPSACATSGTTVTLTSEPDYMSRYDTDWAFSFKVLVQ